MPFVETRSAAGESPGSRRVGTSIACEGAPPDPVSVELAFVTRLLVTTIRADVEIGSCGVHSRSRGRASFCRQPPDREPRRIGRFASGVLAPFEARESMRLKIRNRWLIWLAARLGVAAMRLLYRTLRIRYEFAPGTYPYDDVLQERFIFSVWHEQLILPTFAGRPSQGAALVSRHFDGTYVADTLAALGIQIVRGSTNRGGTQAVRELLEVLKDGHMVLTPDGPRGPRRRIKPGLVYLASRSGRGIIPIACACDRAWVIRGNWTDLIIPKPFARLVVITGPPIYVPPDLSRDEVSREVERVQGLIDAVTERADRYFETGSGWDGSPRGEPARTVPAAKHTPPLERPRAA